MRNKALLMILLACLLTIGMGCRDDPTPDQASRETHPVGSEQNAADQTDQDVEGKEDPAEQVNQLNQEALKAFGLENYEQAVEASTKMYELGVRNIPFLMDHGTRCFAAGKMDKAVEVYDEAIRLRPSIEPQLWQRGLALYYADRFDDGAKQFETHQTVNSQDVENAVWHLLCVARVSSVDEARKKLIPITQDTRVPMSQIYEMFAGRMTPEKVLARAQKETATVKSGSQQQKYQLYHAHLYTGLYHEMLKDPIAAKTSLTKAAEINPLRKTDFMGQVARVHLKLRETVAPRK